ncbi:unnamed protein product [Spirodela intermedia]|uniref:Uncharacterized protein n=1 Tax=Spirodela intermedia TaxID=51605 RepID=A0A7I8IMQ8_SPIIN|nr:unnamed protein product [Spirodela intermedia]CAA6659148.1 unnamed protein product [Spirodela intermedia]
MAEWSERKPEGGNLQARRDSPPLDLRSFLRHQDAAGGRGGGAGPSRGGAKESRPFESQPWSPGARNERQLLGFHVHGF